MKPAYRAMLALFIAIAGVLANSQEPPIPFAQLQGASEFQALHAANDHAGEARAGNLSSVLSTRGSAYIGPVDAVPPRIFNRRYILLNGVHLGLALVDVALTQHCMAEHSCREANPVLPTSGSAQIGVSLGFVAYSAAGSYWMKKHKVKIWWMPPAAGIAAHAAGMTTGLAHW